MKKWALLPGMVFVSFFIISHGLYAQGYDRYGPWNEDGFYALDLTKDQMEKIEVLELEFDKELSPLIAKLRSNYAMLAELEAQGNPASTKIEYVWDVIYRLENDILNREVLHEKKIRDLLTEDQRAIFDTYFAMGAPPYCRGYYGRGFRGGYYGNGIYGTGAGMGRNYPGRGAGRFGRAYYGYGNGIARGVGRNWRYFGRGAGQLGYGNSRFFQGVRYGRGPCGAGLGRWYRWDHGRRLWRWEE